MALDPTARKANVKDSVKKFFVDALSTGEGIEVVFDTLVDDRPPSEPDRWVTVRFGPIGFDYLSECNLSVFCCTRKDSEGFKLAQLRDTVVGYLSDTTRSDGMARIPFYRSYPSQPWLLLGALLVQSLAEEGEGVTADDTKFCLLSVRLRWESKV